MKKIFLFIGIGLTLLAIPATVFFLGQQKDIRAHAAPSTTLSLTPMVQTVHVGDTVKLNVDIDPGTNQVVSADIHLTYDPTQLEAQTITNGQNAPRVLTSGIVENGTASIQVGASSNTQPITTQGTIAVVMFTAKAATSNFMPAQVQFAPNTFVGGLNETTANVLISTAPAKITITDPNANTSTGNFASASAVLEASPSASPSALQILSPTTGNDVSTSQPVIQGTASPGSTVTIVIHSDTAATVTVTADANGNWIYTPTTPLDSGPHTIVASAQNADGTTQTTTTNFVVAGAGEAGATESAVPISGTIETTILLLSIGLLTIISGGILWLF